MSEFDIVVRGGMVHDGSGGEPYAADIAIRDGRIVEVGNAAGRGAEEIDATGRIVTPGFVDIHTHYDGQITWEHTLAPSSTHGVTTVVMGNCGVGFAPCRPGHRELMIKMMEGVEDIPEAVMADGVPFDWETFPDYLDAIEKRHADIDFAAQLPHNPLRVYVMGERGANDEPATAEDLAEMRKLTEEAVRAGAIGVSTTRHTAHRYRSGRNVPTVMLDGDEEVLALAAGLGDAGTGVFEILNDGRRSRPEQLELMRAIAKVSGRPVSFTLTQESESQGQSWRDMLGGLERANAEGLQIKAQVMPRPVGILLGLDLSLNPFRFHPSFRDIENLPLAEKVAALRDPAMRARLLAEKSDDPNPFFKSIVDDLEWLFPLGDPPNYHPDKSDSIAARAIAEGKDPLEVIYDALLEQDGKAVLYRPSANRAGERFEGFGTVCLKHPDVLMGLSDGGAHYGMICDGALPTYFLLHWAGHPDPDKRVELPRAIQKLSSETAEAVGLNDRGRIALGMKADINVIDIDRLELDPPRPSYDLPTGGRRLLQEARGYDATIVSGVVTYRGGKHTGALPGRLVRGAKSAPESVSAANAAMA
jgi:N-acyl-D-amino-acid deacylase